ncbi:MAG: hypothetical protein U1E38_06790 [Rhodospirillales bacterium]
MAPDAFEASVGSDCGTVRSVFTTGARFQIYPEVVIEVLPALLQQEGDDATVGPGRSATTPAP